MRVETTEFPTSANARYTLQLKWKVNIPGVVLVVVVVLLDFRSTVAASTAVPLAALGELQFHR